MIRAHLRRYGALDSRLTLGEPKPEARRANPEILASASEPQKVRLAGCLRAPPRSWTLLIALAGFLRQAVGGGYSGFFSRRATSPTIPRRNVSTQTTKIAPCTTVTQAPSWAR